MRDQFDNNDNDPDQKTAATEDNKIIIFFYSCASWCFKRRLRNAKVKFLRLFIYERAFNITFSRTNTVIISIKLHKYP